MLAHELFGFGLNDFRHITIASAKSTFLPHQKRKILVRSIAEELESEFGLSPEYIEKM
jgi:hypothetical protein